MIEQSKAIVDSATDTESVVVTEVVEPANSRRKTPAVKKKVAPVSQVPDKIISQEKKGASVDHSEQKNRLLDILTPRVELSGKTVLVNLPRGEGVTREYPLRPINSSQDVVKDWVYEQYHSLYGKSPTLQVYKAACNAIRVSLFEREDAKSLLAVARASTVENNETFSASINSDPSLFTVKARVDGHDNLYIFDGCKIGRLKSNEDGDEFIGSLLWGPDTFPKVHKIYTVHDTYEGQQTQYDLEIAGERHVLPIDTLKNGNWISYFPGVTGVLDSSKERLYKAVIMQLAKNAPRVDAYETSGWHKVTVKGVERTVYLLPDGRFLAAKGIDTTGLDVRLIHDILAPEERALWATMSLPSAKPSQEEQQATYDYLKTLAPRGQLLTLLAHNIAALLYSLRSPKFGPSHSLVFVAPPGAGKTSEVGFMRCLSAPYQLKPLPDASFQDTVASVEDDLTYRVSMPVFVDDFVWYGASELKKKEETNILESTSRAVFNQKPVRKRMKSKRSGGMEKQRANYIRTLPVFTVECVPDSLPKSAFRRVLLVEQDANEVAKYPNGRTGGVALSQMERYVPVLQSWGYGIVSFFLDRIEQEGYDQVVEKFARLYRGLLNKTRDELMQKWEELQPHCDIPSDWDSIADAIAYEMLYFQLFRMTVGKGIATSESDLFPHLINAAYEQLLRMDNRVPDEEGLLLFETALLKLVGDIAASKVANGERWRIDANVTRTGDERPPKVTTKNGYTFPYAYWGWVEEVDTEHPVYPRQKIVAYVDDCSAEGGSNLYLYLTDTAREELLKIIRTLPGGEGVTSEKALGDLAEHDGWIGKRPDSKRRATQIVPPQGPRRVWAIRLDKLLAHFSDVDPDEQQAPSNVTQFPKSPAFMSTQQVQAAVNDDALVAMYKDEYTPILPDPDDYDYE